LTTTSKSDKKATTEVVDPKKLAKDFASAAQFNAELSQVYKEDYQKVHKLRQDLKIHHLDLSNAIKTGELIATSTIDNVKRA
jgi:hypothetical protein